MAQTGYTPISIYYSSTAAATPTAGNLVAGELAINTADGKLFYKDSAGVVQVIGTKGGVGSSTTTQVLYNSSGLVVGSANMTFNGTTFTLANDASISGLTVGKGGGAVSTNTAVGVSALTTNTTGTTNTAIGFSTLNANTSGLDGTAVGAYALYKNTTGNYNSALGGSNSSPALYNNTTGSSNSAFGTGALFSNTTASNNTAVGYQAGYSNTTGTDNAYFGRNAGYQNTGGSNTALGAAALYASGTGGSNVAIGATSLFFNTSGGSNVGVGVDSLRNNTTASNNTAVGYQAGYSNTTGTYQTLIGFQAGNNSTTPSSGNTCVGANSGSSLTTGASNTFIGSQGLVSQGSGGLITTGSKNSILGNYNGNQGGLDIRTASNYIVLSDGNGNPRMVSNGSGQWGIGGTPFPSNTSWFNTPDMTFYNPVNSTEYRYVYYSNSTKYLYFTNGSNSAYLSNTGAWTNASDGRLKNSIIDIKHGLDSVMATQPRSFKFNNAEGNYVGFIAQELQTVIPEVVSGDPAEQLGVDYGSLVAVAFKAIQELKAEVDSLKQQLGK